jgi:MFS family permease
MFWADRLVRQHGAHRLLLLSFLIDAAMYGLVAVWPSIAAIIIMRCFFGVSFSLFSVAFIMFIQERAPAEQTATRLALYGVTLRNLVFMVGGPLSGLIFDYAGPLWIYAVAAAGGLLAFLVLRATVTGKRSVVGQGV